MPVAIPFLKCAGGKRQLILDLMRFIPKKFGTYYEPFLGGGALFFHLRSCGLISKAVLGDQNACFIGAYKQVQYRVEDLIRDMSGLVYSRLEYDNARSRLNYLIKKADYNSVGSLVIYLNHTCFNGLWRTNRKGEFNVPFGRYTNPAICDAENLQQCSAALQNVDIRCLDFFTASANAERGDLVYYDPPYWPAGGYANFVFYTKEGFGPADQERLARHAERLAKRGVHVVLSNADVKEVRKLYKGWVITRVQARRNINSKTSARGPVGEVIISKKGPLR